MLARLSPAELTALRSSTAVVSGGDQLRPTIELKRSLTCALRGCKSIVSEYGSSTLVRARPNISWDFDVPGASVDHAMIARRLTGNLDMWTASALRLTH